MHKLTKSLTSIIAVLLFAAPISWFSGFTSNASGAADETSDLWFSEKTSSARPSNSDDDAYLLKSGKPLSYLTVYPEVLSIEDMLKQAALVVRGRVLGFDYLTIKPVLGGSPTVHTDYYIEPLEVLRGEPAEKSKPITVRARGGENDKMIVVNGNLSLIAGQEYLFFLDKPVTGGGYNTKGDYYYVSGGGSIGVFVASGDETRKNERGSSVPKTFYPYEASVLNDKALDYLSFAAAIRSYNEGHPVDEMFIAERYYRDIKANLESGFITQEEYAQSIACLDIYASIVE
ncbi:MAG: hypothetical protein LBL15_02015 [Oscillospiraceae bacterium]|jgi:hypothetical protein|nr:hypothetical protein [Oscillospiraceae bacterium]